MQANVKGYQMYYVKVGETYVGMDIEDFATGPCPSQLLEKNERCLPNKGRKRKGNFYLSTSES